MRRYLVLVASLATVPALWAQLAISARSGMIHYVEGAASLQGEPVKLKFGQFPEVAPDHVLATEEGRAEVLLNPGVFLRLDHNSSFRMISNKLTDTKVELVSGDALIEVEELPKDNRIQVSVGEASTELQGRGLYLFQTNPARVRVYDGRVQVSQNQTFLTVKRGHQVEFAPVLVSEKFNLKETSDLYTWSLGRASLLAGANLTAARSANSAHSHLSSSYWAWNPTLGLYTFLPRAGYINSPFGLYWYSPGTIWMFYGPPVYQRGYQGPSGRAETGWSGLGEIGSRSGAASAPVYSPAPASGGIVRSGGAPAAAPVSAGGGRQR